MTDSNAKSDKTAVGTSSKRAATRRKGRSSAYREASAEYKAISELRKKNWIAAHLRERRYELELTQEQVAARAGTSHSAISRLEAGIHMPTIAVLQRILGALDESLLIGIERQGRDEEKERELGPVPTAV